MYFWICVLDIPSGNGLNCNLLWEAPCGVGLHQCSGCVFWIYLNFRDVATVHSMLSIDR